MHFPFSHQIPLSKFGAWTRPQADTISLCGIFPALPHMLAAKLVAAAVREPGLQKRQPGPAQNQDADAAASSAPPAPSPDSGRLPALPPASRLMTGPSRGSEPFKRPKERRGCGMHTFPLSLSGSLFYFLQHQDPIVLSFSSSIRIYPFPTTSQAFVQGWGETEQDRQLFLQGFITPPRKLWHNSNDNTRPRSLSQSP